MHKTQFKELTKKTQLVRNRTKSDILDFGYRKMNSFIFSGHNFFTNSLPLEQRTSNILETFSLWVFYV